MPALAGRSWLRVMLRLTQSGAPRGRPLIGSKPVL